MKDVDITQAFCEVLTGLAFLLMIFPLLVMLGSYDLQEVALFVIEGLSVAGLAAILVIAYLFGTIMDAVGMSIDRLVLNKLIIKAEPTQDERAKFWRSVSEHVLAYRDAQWTYYSCYRNLFILFIPGGILWTIFAWARVGSWLGVVTVIGVIALEAALFVTMKSLVEIYFKITTSFQLEQHPGQTVPV